MPTLTISFTPPDPAPLGYVVNYRVKDSGSGYTTLLPVPTTSPVVIPVADANTNYEGSISAYCGEGDTSPIVNFVTNNCFCPDGYTVSPDNTYCYQELSQAATYTGGANPYQACHFTYEQYSMYGTVVYQMNGYNSDGTWTTPPNIYTILTPASLSGANVIHLASGPFINSAQDASGGRLNASGLWVCGNQNYGGTLGFSRQFNVDSSKVYYVGLGADNYASIALNGTTIVSQSVGTMGVATQMNDTSGAFLFRYWFLYPVQLQAGINLLEINGINTGGIGVFGCEIYDATEAQLLACGSDTDLQPYIVFSTKDVTNNADFDTGNYSCSGLTGYQLVYDSTAGTYSCKIVNKAVCSG